MNRSRDRRDPGSPGRSQRRIFELIEDATVDAYGDSEQRLGFFCRIEENLQLPFETDALGVKVTVRRLALTPRDEIVACCHSGSHRQVIPLLDLPLPDPPPEGAEWIAAYRQWSRDAGRDS